MKAIALTPGHTDLRLVERPEPSISAPDQVKLRVVQVGICGTDREEAAGGRADAPRGRDELVIGHEMLGQVVETGNAVHDLAPGSYAVFTVRRGCNRCAACLAGRADMCFTGDYTERGIKGADGYDTEYVVDSAAHLIPIPDELATIGVLTEPMSVSQKAIQEAELVQRSRLGFLDSEQKPLAGKKVLVAGLGAVGLLAAIGVALEGAQLYGMDVVDEDNPRARIVTEIGGVYVDGRSSLPSAIDQHYGNIDVIIEATGADHLEFDLIHALGPNGVYVLTGLPGSARPIEIDGATLVRQIVLGNQIIVGSVNASRANFQQAVDDLVEAKTRWGGAIDSIITHRFPVADFKTALTVRQPDEIKSVIQWRE